METMPRIEPVGIEPVVSPSTTGSARSWSQRLRPWRKPAIVALIALYLAGWGFSASFPITTTDLDAFFLPSAVIMLGGHPWSAYVVRYAVSYPNANGPFSLLPLTAVSWLVQRLGWLNDPTPRRVVIMVFFAIFSLLLSYEGVRAVDRLRGMVLRGPARLLLYAVFALTPQLWHSVLFYGHIEQPIEIWLLLLGTRLLVERRAGWAGLCMGLMLLTRTSSLVFFLPLLVVLVCRRHWLMAAQVAVVGSVVPVLGVLPFWLGDRADTLYSLVTFRSELGVGGGNVWGLAIGTPLEAFAQAHDSLVVLGASVLIALVASLARPSLDIDSQALFALLAVTSFCFPLLIKTMWPYYFLEPYVLISVWWLAGLPRVGLRPRLLWLIGLVLPVGVLGIAQAGELGAGLVNTLTFVHAWSLAMTVSMLLVMALLTAFGLIWTAPRRGWSVVSGEALQPGYNL
jgi:hypothetical protein